MKTFIILLLFSLAFAACKKDHKNCLKDCTEATGIITDLTGKLDGCRILITLPDGTKLEPIKSPEGFTYTAGKTVEFCYEEKASASICMSGPTVIVKSIQYIP